MDDMYSPIAEKYIRKCKYIFKRNNDTNEERDIVLDVW
jgi:hypothetical protein